MIVLSYRILAKAHTEYMICSKCGKEFNIKDAVYCDKCKTHYCKNCNSGICEICCDHLKYYS